MILQRFFKPKWQHRNPQIRKQAMIALPDQAADTAAILEEAALQDPDGDIRRLAVRRVAKLAVIDKVLQSEQDDGIVGAARARLQQLLAGKHQPCPALQERVDRLAQLNDDKMLEYLVKQGQEPELRRAALEKLSREALFGDVAIGDSDADVRLHAVNKIQRKSTLDRVYKASKGKDKKVSAIAKQRLDAIEAEEQRPQMLQQQARQICVTLEALYRGGDWQRTRLQLPSSNDKWRALQVQWTQSSLGVFDAELQARFTKVTADIEAAIVQHQEQLQKEQQAEAKRDPLRARKREIIRAGENRLLALQSQPLPLTKQDAEELGQQLNLWQTQWQEIETLPGDEEQPLAVQFQAVVKSLNNHVREQQIFARYLIELDKLIQKADTVKDDWLTTGQIEKLKKQKTQLRASTLFGVDKDKEARLTTRLSQLESKARHNAEQNEANKLKLHSLMEAFSKALGAGRVRDGNQIKRDIHNLAGRISKADMASIRRGSPWRLYQDELQQFHELADWRAWANVPVKQQLAEEMAQLAAEVRDGEQHDYNAMAQFIREKRDEWKKIGQSEASDENVWWEAFNQACNEIYEVCREHFQTQREQRTQNKERKESICNDLQVYLDKLAPADADLHLIEKIINTARREWREAGSVDRKFNQQLNERFHEILERLKAVLVAERDKAREKKETLIAKAEAIAVEITSSKNQQAEIREAVNAIKNVQSEWKRIGRAAKEKELWKRFRSFCDAVFTLRDELNDKRDSLLIENTQRKSGILADLSALLCTEPFDFNEAHGRIKQLLRDWEEAGRVPKDKEKDLDRQMRDLKNTYKDKQDQAARQAKRDNLKHLRDRAGYCLALEMRLGEVLDSAQIEDARQQWQALPAIDAKAQSLMQARLDKALGWLTGSFDDDPRAWMVENQGIKQELCLKLEIFAGVESPEAFKEHRMAYQVAQLAEKMTGDKEDGHDDDETFVQNLVLRWYAVGRAEKEEDISERFDSVVEKIRPWA